MDARDETPDFDVIVVGGGPAGLSAALVLGRSRRRVLLCDDGRYRNRASHGLHGYLTRDGILPAEFLRLGREELERYGIQVERAEVLSLARDVDAAFLLRIAGGRTARGKKVLLATGVEDRVPDVEGMADLYGVSVHHCPYCDGWEWRDGRLAVYGQGLAAAGLAHALRGWTEDVVVLTDGPAGLRADARRDLERRGIELIDHTVASLEGTNGRLERVRFRTRDPLERDAIFLATGHQARVDLAEGLTCRIDRKGAIWTDRRQCSSVHGLYVAGDASRDVQFVIVAASEGASAAVAINTELLREERENGVTAIARDDEARRA